MQFWPYSISAVFWLIALTSIGLYFLSQSANRRLYSLTAIASLVAVGAVGVYLPAQETDQRARKAIYQHTLVAYQAGFPIGLTRQEVNDRLRAKQIRFFPTCCRNTDAPFDNYVTIGQEAGPWFCGTIVDIVFLYSGSQTERPNPTNTLQDIRLHHQLACGI